MHNCYKLDLRSNSMEIISRKQLRDYALGGCWDKIETYFSSCDQDDMGAMLPFARDLLKNRKGNLQDLGAKIFQKYRGQIINSDRGMLREVIAKPGNEFAKYRAGFALWSHGQKVDDVKKVLEEAKKCSDVKSIAAELLKQE